MSHGRVDYDGDGLTEEQLLDTPYAQARAWVDDAVARAQERSDVFEPLAISVATVDADGPPERAHRAHALPRRARARLRHRADVDQGARAARQPGGGGWL